MLLKSRLRATPAGGGEGRLAWASRWRKGARELPREGVRLPRGRRRGREQDPTPRKLAPKDILKNVLQYPYRWALPTAPAGAAPVLTPQPYATWCFCVCARALEFAPGSAQPRVCVGSVRAGAV